MTVPYIGANIGFNTIILPCLVGSEGLEHVFEPDELPPIYKTNSRADKCNACECCLQGKERKNIFVQIGTVEH